MLRRALRVATRSALRALGVPLLTLRPLRLRLRVEG